MDINRALTIKKAQASGMTESAYISRQFAFATLAHRIHAVMRFRPIYKAEYRKAWEESRYGH